MKCDKRVTKEKYLENVLLISETLTSTRGVGVNIPGGITCICVSSRTYEVPAFLVDPLKLRRGYPLLPFAITAYE
jgi:hypothetical protein